jgi:hypothetical protein
MITGIPIEAGGTGYHEVRADWSAKRGKAPRTRPEIPGPAETKVQAVKRGYCDDSEVSDCLYGVFPAERFLTGNLGRVGASASRRGATGFQLAGRLRPDGGQAECGS